MVDSLDTNKFDVTIVSPRNYFLFYPELANAAVGTVDFESVVEPIRLHRSRHQHSFTYLEATCEDIDVPNKKIVCKPLSQPEFEVPFDHLVIAVGTHNNTHHIPGVRENTFFLTSLKDAQKLRNEIIGTLEAVTFESVSEEERRRRLHFVVVGGGPVARETAARLYDFLTEKTKLVYPTLEQYMKVSIVKVDDYVHNYYDHIIAKNVAKKTKRPGMQMYKDKILDISENALTLYSEDRSTVRMPFGTCIWATGRTSTPFVRKIAAKFPENQNSSLALVVDAKLRVLGSENIYAVGDCATIDQQTLVEKWESLFEQSDLNKDGVIDKQEFKGLCETLGTKYPALLELKNFADEIFVKYDKDGDAALGVTEFKNILEKFNNKLTRFPSTASTAVQQGNFLGDFFNKGQHTKPDEEVTAAFRYKHFGGYEYIGAEKGLKARGSKGGAIMGSPGAWWMWKNVYWSTIVGVPMSMRLYTSKLYSHLFGRPTTRI